MRALVHVTLEREQVGLRGVRHGPRDPWCQFLWFARRAAAR